MFQLKLYFALMILAYNWVCILDFYKLKQAPFDLTPNPRFLFQSRKHREAYNHLLYGIRERKGFVQLTGEVGAGRRRSAARCFDSSTLILPPRSFSTPC